MLKNPFTTLTSTILVLHHLQMADYITMVFLGGAYKELINPVRVQVYNKRTAMLLNSIKLIQNLCFHVRPAKKVVIKQQIQTITYVTDGRKSYTPNSPSFSMSLAMDPKGRVRKLPSTSMNFLSQVKQNTFLLLLSNVISTERRGC